MPARLTAGELKSIERSLDGGHLISAATVRPLLDELRERRSIDLTSNEVAALRWVQAIVRQFPQAAMQPRAFAALDRLLNGAE